MPAKKHSSDSRKLRASCDTCYQAKVKCSKSRPLCQRCLISGTNCTYSPSARSGRAPRVAGGRDPTEGETIAAGYIEEGPNFEPLPSTMYNTSPNYNHSEASQSFDPDDCLPTSTYPASPGHPTPAYQMYAEPVLTMNGEGASTSFGEGDDFGISNSCFWTQSPIPNPTNIATNFAGYDVTQYNPSQVGYSDPRSYWSNGSDTDLNYLSYSSPGIASYSTNTTPSSNGTPYQYGVNYSYEMSTGAAYNSQASCYEESCSNSAHPSFQPQQRNSVRR